MVVGGGGGAEVELGDSHPLGPKHEGLVLVCPVFFDVEVPFPGQQVVLVVISEFGFDVILAARHQSCGSFFQRGQEVVFSITRPVAAHHVVRLIDWGQKTVDSTLRYLYSLMGKSPKEEKNENTANLENNQVHQMT